MRKFAIVTTFNDDGYNRYGKNMIECFDKYWDKDVDLYVYYEESKPTHSSSRVHYVSLNEVSPDIVAFKQKYKNDPVANGNIGISPNGISRPEKVSEKWKSKSSFLWDAVRFSHKVYAICHAARNVEADVLIWMDADIVTHDNMTLQFLSGYTPEDVYTCSLKRDGKYTECGFVSYNLRHPYNETFMSRWENLYNSGELFDMREWHDSYVYDQVRIQLENENKITSHSYSGEYSNTGHPFVNCELGNYMDHLKGNRKDVGHSRQKDLRRERKEDHWKNLNKK